MGTSFDLSKAIQPTESKVITDPIISVKVVVSMIPLATSVPPMKVSKWRSSAMTAAFIIGRFGWSGLRLRNSPMIVNVFTCEVLQILDSRLRIVLPIRQRREPRRVWATPESVTKGQVLRLPKGCPRTKPLDCRGLYDPTLRRCAERFQYRESCESQRKWRTRICGRRAWLRCCERCEFGVGQPCGVEGGGKYPDDLSPCRNIWPQNNPVKCCIKCYCT